MGISGEEPGNDVAQAGHEVGRLARTNRRVRRADHPLARRFGIGNHQTDRIGRVLSADVTDFRRQEHSSYESASIGVICGYSRSSSRRVRRADRRCTTISRSTSSVRVVPCLLSSNVVGGSRSETTRTGTGGTSGTRANKKIVRCHVCHGRNNRVVSVKVRTFDFREGPWIW